MRAAGGRRSGLRRSGLVGLLLVALTGLSGCSGDESVAPPKAPRDSSNGRAAAAQRTLDALGSALSSRDAGAAASLAAPGARATLDAMVANARSLDLQDISLRFVDDQSTLGTDDRETYGAAAWPGTVELTYRIAGWDTQPTRLETRFVFTGSGGKEQIAGVGGGDSRTPLWLTGPVTRLASGRAMVISGDPSGQRYLGLAEQALVDVAKVLPGWHGKLVVEGPASEKQLDAALAAPQDQYANIAAVTTSVDGSLVPGSPVHVFLNPRVFDALGPRGAQVVLSHETTHVATGATFVQMPTWLLEGFADYVALAHAGIPVSTAASQILARIRKQGTPDHLPTSADLDPTATGLGATYEEAWLATRFLAQLYGEPKLVAFYRAVSAGKTTDQAFHSILGTTEAAFVRRWRADLNGLVGGVTS